MSFVYGRMQSCCLHTAFFYSIVKVKFNGSNRTDFYDGLERPCRGYVKTSNSNHTKICNGLELKGDKYYSKYCTNRTKFNNGLEHVIEEFDENA